METAGTGSEGRSISGTVGRTAGSGFGIVAQHGGHIRMTSRRAPSRARALRRSLPLIINKWTLVDAYPRKLTSRSSPQNNKFKLQFHPPLLGASSGYHQPGLLMSIGKHLVFTLTVVRQIRPQSLTAHGSHSLRIFNPSSPNSRPSHSEKKNFQPNYILRRRDAFSRLTPILSTHFRFRRGSNATHFSLGFHSRRRRRRPSPSDTDTRQQHSFK